MLNGLSVWETTSDSRVVEAQTTLWKVDDRASFMLMRAFYEGLASKGPTEALRAAQRALTVDFPHPFAWAGFGLTGAPR